MLTRLCRGLLLAALLTACSVSISDVTMSAGHVTTVPPQTSPSGGPTTLSADQGPVAAGNTPVGSSQVVGQIPVTWTGLGLSGVLVFSQGNLGLLKLDLASGQETALLPANQLMWLSAASTSPDGQTVMLAYSPPPANGEIQLGYTGIYSIAGIGSSAAPIPILPRADPQESYFMPVWSPDGRYVYYSHFVPIRDPNGQGNAFQYSVERMAYPVGQPEPIVKDAVWPRVSPDGSKLLYVRFDPVQYTQALYIADVNGKNAKQLLSLEQFPSVDSEFFSPDGGTVVFNAANAPPTPAPAAFSWLDELLGVGRADAHNVPSDWWAIHLADGRISRLTQLYDTGMNGGFSPDGRHIAFLSATGLYVMAPDGGHVTQLARLQQLGTLEWRQ